MTVFAIIAGGNVGERLSGRHGAVVALGALRRRAFEHVAYMAAGAVGVGVYAG